MARKLGIVGGVAVLCATVLGLGVASSTSGIASPITLTVFEHSTTDKVIDVGTHGDSTGDILTFHNKLFDETDTTKVGTLQGQCVRESPRAGTWECWWTMSLADGQVTVEGPFSDTSNTAFAVTGGTGIYENVRGSMQVEAINGGVEYKQTFSLIP
jgi:allene oxide cyclase